MALASPRPLEDPDGLRAGLGPGGFSARIVSTDWARWMGRRWGPAGGRVGVLRVLRGDEIALETPLVGRRRAWEQRAPGSRGAPAFYGLWEGSGPPGGDPTRPMLGEIPPTPPTGVRG